MGFGLEVFQLIDFVIVNMSYKIMVSVSLVLIRTAVAPSIIKFLLQFSVKHIISILGALQEC